MSNERKNNKMFNSLQKSLDDISLNTSINDNKNKFRKTHSADRSRIYEDIKKDNKVYIHYPIPKPKKKKKEEDKLKDKTIEKIDIKELEMDTKLIEKSDKRINKDIKGIIKEGIRKYKKQLNEQIERDKKNNEKSIERRHIMISKGKEYEDHAIHMLMNSE